MSNFDNSLDHAKQLDADDPLRTFRDRFLFPKQDNGTPYRYFCGNSLGLQPATAKAALEIELNDWGYQEDYIFVGDEKPYINTDKHFRYGGAGPMDDEYFNDMFKENHKLNGLYFSLL